MKGQLNSYHKKYFIPMKCADCGKIFFIPNSKRNPQPKGLYPVRNRNAYTCSKICSQKLHRMNPRLRKLKKQNYKKLNWEEI